MTAGKVDWEVVVRTEPGLKVALGRTDGQVFKVRKGGPGRAGEGSCPRRPLPQAGGDAAPAPRLCCEVRPCPRIHLHEVRQPPVGVPYSCWCPLSNVPLGAGPHHKPFGQRLCLRWATSPCHAGGTARLHCTPEDGLSRACTCPGLSCLLAPCLPDCAADAAMTTGTRRPQQRLFTRHVKSRTSHRLAS